MVLGVAAVFEGCSITLAMLGPLRRCVYGGMKPMLQVALLRVRRVLRGGGMLCGRHCAHRDHPHGHGVAQQATKDQQEDKGHGDYAVHGMNDSRSWI